MSALHVMIRQMGRGDVPAAALSGELGYPATRAQIERRFEHISRSARV